MCFMECPVSQLLHQPGQCFFRKYFAYQLLYVPRFLIQGKVWCASGSHLEYGVELLQKSIGMKGAQCQRNTVLPLASTIAMDRVLEEQDWVWGRKQELGDQNSVSKACHEALATFNNSIKYYFSHFFLFKYAYALVTHGYSAATCGTVRFANRFHCKTFWQGLCWEWTITVRFSCSLNLPLIMHSFFFFF